MKKKDKLLNSEQATKQLHISQRTLNNARSSGTGIVIAHISEVRGLLDIVASSEQNTLNQTEEIKGLLD